MVPPRHPHAPGFRVVDADGHVLEPPDLWERHLDPAFRHQAPRGFGMLSVEVLGRRMPDIPGGVPEGSPQYGDGPNARYGFAARRGFDAESQLEAMDVEGIDLAVLYPSRGPPAHGGRLWAAPKDHHGATLSFTLSARERGS